MYVSGNHEFSHFAYYFAVNDISVMVTCQYCNDILMGRCWGGGTQVPSIDTLCYVYCVGMRIRVSDHLLWLPLIHNLGSNVVWRTLVVYNISTCRMYVVILQKGHHIGFIIANFCFHFSDVIMGAMAFQIICVSIIYSKKDKRKHQSSASLAFVRGIHRWPGNSPHKGPVTRKMFTFDGVIIYCIKCFVMPTRWI